MSDIVTGLTAEQVTNFYLYGQASAPENMADAALLRPATNVTVAWHSQPRESVFKLNMM